MGRVFVTRDLPGDALKRLEAEHEVEVWPERLPPPPAELRARAGEAEGLFCMLTDPVDRARLEAASRLRAVSNLAVGIDNVDLEAATERGLPVGFTPDVLTETTADLAVALMLAAARLLPEAEAAVRAGEWLTWEPGWLLGRDLHGATVGIIGLGRIGRAVARRLEGFGVELLHTGRQAGTSREQLLERSHFDGRHRGREPERGPSRRAHAPLREPRGLRPSLSAIPQAP